MKKLQFFIPLLIIFMVLNSCQKEEILNVPLDTNDPNLVLLKKKKHPVPFHATFTSTVESFMQNDEVCGENSGAFNLLQSVSGNATHMGNISGTVSSCVIPFVIIFNGTVTLVAANGDELWFDQTGPGAFDINGGTGRFEGADGNVTGSFETIVPGSVFSNQFDGVVQY